MIRHLDIEKFSAINPVVTIGIFDGVHTGHRYILDKLKETAKKRQGESVLLTFWPHPMTILHPERDDFRLLNSVNEKAELLEAAGLDHLLVIPFTKSFSQLKVNDFVKEILVDKIGVSFLMVGYNQKLGYKREGDFSRLKTIAGEYGFGIEKLPAFAGEANYVSSSKIRKYLIRGEVAGANQLLGRNYSFSGMVTGGSKLGTSIGFPTANIIPDTAYKLLPASGVYAVTARLMGNAWKGMMNIGSRPTVNKNPEKKTIEVHLLEFDENIYSEQIHIEFVTRLRDEKKFSGINELKQQLLVDRENTQKVFINSGKGNSL